MFTLAAPVVIAELGWMVMGMVDTLMVGRLSPEAIGAVGLGSSLFMAVGVFAMGLLLGMDTLVAQAFGGGRLDDCHRWLLHGVVLAVVLALPVTAILLYLGTILDSWGIDPAVRQLTRPYLDVVTVSVLPLLLYFGFRRYLQGMGSVRPVMVTLLLANLANVVMNWTFIYGNLGAPRLGVAGAAWATVASRLVMAGSLFAVILYREHGRRPGLFEVTRRIEPAWMRRLLALGFPASMQLTLEVGVFAAASALAALLTPAALAAHQIALNLAGFTFMVPLGIASAGAVRVGQAIGRRDGHAAARAGWTALLLGGVFMTAAAIVFITLPEQLIGAFTSDADVLATGVTLLAVAAVFQLFDGLQGVGTGVLRGAGDTRTPMLWNLAAHWFIGLPIGYVLAFPLGFGVVGLWCGLSVGLIICGVALISVWWRRSASVPHLLSQPAGGPMPEQNQPPRPHGDPLEREIVEENQAQRQSDAPAGVAGDSPEGLQGEHDRSAGRASTADGVPASNEDDGGTRRRHYDGGAELVSRID
jgi:MATE family multidrug resistance protein